MQSLTNSMISGGGVTVSGINIIPSSQGGTINTINAVGHPVAVSATANQSTHHLGQPTNIQLIIATKSLPQAVPVATAQIGQPVAVKQEVISIPVSAQMGLKQEVIALPVVTGGSQVPTMFVTSSALSSLTNNNGHQIIATQATPVATHSSTNIITTTNNNTITVTGQTPGLDLLACLECGKHFVSVAKLKSHEKTHSKSRPFKCIDCNKSFTVRYSLICHTRTHTRERPYQCSQCGSRFTQASSLKTHQIYKHTKNFPYACKQCDRGFISPGQRHEHVVRTHLKLPGSSSSRSKSKSKSKSSASSNSLMNNTTSANINSLNNSNSSIKVEIVSASSETSVADRVIQTEPNNTNTVTLVNATLLQAADGSTVDVVQPGQLDTDQLPPGSTITLAIQAITSPDSDDSLGPSMSSAACQTSLSLPPLL